MKEIIKKAKKIVELEKTQQYEELEKFASTLSLEEMLEIDNYIMEEKLLTNHLPCAKITKQIVSAERND